MIYENQTIDTIIFDLGGVILNIDYQLPVKAFKKLRIENFNELFSQASQSNLFNDYETGEISSDDFIKEIKKIVDVNNNITKEKIFGAFNKPIVQHIAELKNKLQWQLKNIISIIKRRR